MRTIVTGDNVAIPVQLTKDGAAFDIPTSKVVKAMLVGRNSSEKYMESPVTLISTTAGSDWTKSLVVVLIPGTATAGITYQGKAILEIQETVETGVVDETWFLPVMIRKGYVE